VLLNVQSFNFAQLSARKIGKEAPEEDVSCVKSGISWRKLRMSDCRVPSLYAHVCGKDQTGARRHAKSNYTAIKPAYNSRSQAPPGAPQ
jgi:hypothetical protein